MRLNSLKWQERKGGKEVERERRGSERDEESTRGRYRWGSDWMRKEEDCQRERDRDREKDEENMRIGEGRLKSRKNRYAETACLQ